MFKSYLRLHCVIKQKTSSSKHLLSFTILFLLSTAAISQPAEKVFFNDGDSTTNYYLAIPPSGNITATLVLLCAYRNPEIILPETMLHNVAAANNILTVYASVGMHFIPDDSALQHINKLI